MSDRGVYSRVYHSVVDDPEFATVYDDDRRLAAWLRLLIVADQAYPASAHIPAGTHRPTLMALVDAGLVELGTGSRYRIHGMEAERARRAEAGRAGGLASGRARTNVQPPSNERSTVVPEVVQPVKQSREVEEQSSTRERPDGRADLEAFLVITRRAPTPRQRRLLDDVLDRHDLTGPAWAADVMYRNPADPIGAVIEADKAWRSERIAEAQAQERPKPQPRRSMGMPQSTRDLMADFAASMKGDDAA